MHSVLVRRYKYKYGREGIVPGTWYSDYMLDPCSVSLGYFAMDLSIMKVNAIVTELHDQDGKVVYDSWVLRRKEEYLLFTLDEDKEITDVDHVRYEKQFQISPHVNSIDIARYSTLVIDGTEYNNQYVREHLNDLRILLDQIRTDTLLEEMDV